jgi:head-tail adaptor
VIGGLNQRARILARTLTPDGGGGFRESWETVATVWAALEPLTAVTKYGPDLRETRVRHRITLRRIAGLAVGQRVTVGPRTFRVTALLDRGLQSATLNLLCEELQ